MQLLANRDLSIDYSPIGMPLALDEYWLLHHPFPSVVINPDPGMRCGMTLGRFTNAD
jgi:hypothetical protein